MTTDNQLLPVLDIEQIVKQIKQLAQSFGFQDARICRPDVSQHVADVEHWLAQGYAADMDYLHNNKELRYQPDQLIANCRSVISLRMDYLPQAAAMKPLLNSPEKAYISRYALGRDYHKLIRKRATQLGQAIHQQLAPHGFRAFVDSAPILERQLAEQAGLGWRGKHSLLINTKAGSWFFLAEILTDLELPADPPQASQHCGSCTACLEVCPTQAIVAEGVVDARRCISYLTIENKGAISEELRPLMGNRIYGCDDCQLFCPWTKFSQPSQESDFQPRQQLDDISLLELWAWTEDEFLQRTQGSPIRRTGYQGWRRNLAVALGNAPYQQAIIQALTQGLNTANELVSKHIHWAIKQQEKRRPTNADDSADAK